MIVGRTSEQARLEKIYCSQEAEFIAVHGRRRIGKTYLIREYFSNKKCLFMHVTGVDQGSLKTQLAKFSEALSNTYFSNEQLAVPGSWDDAFSVLNRQIISNPNQKTVIFLDELPWLATNKSGLLQTINHYWNHHWSKLNHVILIVCGSSASWMMKNIIYNKGGLHNRVTYEMRLLPFTLSEAKAFLKYRKVKLNNRHLLSLYMALGGVPFYLKYVDPGLTASQNIQQIIFDDNAPLKDEFNKLFKSLFNYADAYIELIMLLSKHSLGMTRANIQSTAKLSTNGGRLTERLEELCSAGFIIEQVAWQKQKGVYYKLIDEFCLFYLHWVGTSKNRRFIKNHWLEQSKRQSYKAWSGYAFECVCFKHIDQIVSALGIQSGGYIDSWRFIPRKHTENGAQIDLLIDRQDDAITVCEIKHTDKPFVIDKAYAAQLENKLKAFKRHTQTTKHVFLSLISANGVKRNLYFDALIQSVVTLNDLFD